MRTKLGVTTQGSTRWLASAAATAASTYALDAIATACGIAAVASGALDGLGTSVVVGLLGLSYVGWLAGLVSAMRANVALVDRTGLSTDVVSKAAYDLARRRSGGDRRPGSRPPAVMSRPRPPRRCPTSSGRSGHVFAVADVADEIDLAEHLPANRARVRRWLDAAPGAHDWRPFVRHTLRCEGLAEPSPIDIQRRESLTREQVKDVVAVDLRNPVPDPERYDIVVSCCCADAATADAREWTGFVRTIAEQVEPGGLLLMAALCRCRGYVVGGHRFPCAGIDEHDLRRVLEGAWGPGSTSVAVVELSDQPAHG